MGPFTSPGVGTSEPIEATPITKIESTKDLDAESEKALAATIEDFKKNGTW